MANSKVQLADGTVIIDISDTTATEGDVLPGKTLYKADGTKATGSLGTATESSDGLMSAEDKAKLDGIEEHATENKIVKSVDRSSVASFQDGADNLPMELKIGIEPVQDLHGYDAPWPAGGSRNIYSGPQTVTKDASVTLVEVALPVPIPAGTYTMTAAVTLASGVSAARASFRKSDKTAITYIQSLAPRSPDRSGGEVTLSEDCYYIYFYGTADTSTKSAATFADIQIESGSSATEYAPYSNICPISGWTGTKITKIGKNLIPDGTNTANGYELDKYLIIDGTTTAAANNYISEYFPVEANGTYTMHSKTKTLNNACVCFYDENKNYIAGSAVNYQKKVKTITAPATAVWARATQGYNTADFAQFEKGSVPTEIVPYSCNEYQIDFPDGAGTVYGGTLTVNKDGTGTLVVNKASVMMASLNWSTEARSESWDTFKIGRTTLGAAKSNDVISNVFHYDAGNPWNLKYPTSYNNLYLSVPTLSSFDTTALATLLTELNAQMVFNLATPQTYQLTALEVIETLKGINNIFANTGDILSVEYQTTAASDIVDVMKPQIKDLLNAIFPVGTIYTTTSRIAPTFGEGWTWQEVVVPLTWGNLKTGDRSAYAGTSTGSFHYWKRIA